MRTSYRGIPLEVAESSDPVRLTTRIPPLMKQRLMIADERTLLREGLSRMLAAQDSYRVVAEVPDTSRAWAAAAAQRLDIVVCSHTLPVLGAVEFTTQMKQRHPGICVVVLAASATGTDVRAALEAGVDGYLMLDASFDELLVALRTVAMGKKYLSAEISDQLVDAFLNGGNGTAKVSAWDAMTQRERSVLKLVTEGRSNRTTASLMNVSQKTVEKYRAKLMRRFEVRHISELTLIAYEKGLIERPGTVERNLGPGDGSALGYASRLVPGAAGAHDGTHSASWGKAGPTRPVPADMAA
jgi:DNA-binding NarL/FixJ family response regulator